MNVKNTVSGGGPIATRFSLAEIVELVGGAIPPVPAVPASTRISARLKLFGMGALGRIVTQNGFHSAMQQIQYRELPPAEPLHNRNLNQSDWGVAGRTNPLPGRFSSSNPPVAIHVLRGVTVLEALCCISSAYSV